MFDPQYIQFKPKGAGVTLYFTRELMRKNQRPNQVCAVATSLQLFNKADLQAIMKAGRWSSGGTFTSFYLKDLCPQADSIRKTGPVVAAGEIVEISS